MIKCDICSRVFEEKESFRYYNYDHSFYRYNMGGKATNSYKDSLANREHYYNLDNLGLYLCFDCDAIKLKVIIIDIPRHLPRDQYKRFALTILRKGT